MTQDIANKRVQPTCAAAAWCQASIENQQISRLEHLGTEMRTALLNIMKSLSAGE